MEERVLSERTLEWLGNVRSNRLEPVINNYGSPIAPVISREMLREHDFADLVNGCATRSWSTIKLKGVKYILAEGVVLNVPDGFNAKASKQAVIQLKEGASIILNGKATFQNVSFAFYSGSTPLFGLAEGTNLVLKTCHMMTEGKRCWSRGCNSSFRWFPGFGWKLHGIKFEYQNIWIGVWCNQIKFISPNSWRPNACYLNHWRLKPKYSTKLFIFL